jgi:phospholipid-translocating ATPase
MIVYTGRDTRAVMNTGAVVGQKMGRIEWEINKMAKVCARQAFCGRARKKVDGAL